MSASSDPARRRFLGLLAAAPLAPLAAVPFTVQGQNAPRVMTARVARQKLVDGYPDTDVWTFDGAVPGPELRFRQGDTLRIDVANRLPQPTTVHWHGIRLPNAMDGVPHLTQPPIRTGATFRYEFALPDAGTYWYHPHERSHEQVARGLYGALIVEEPRPPQVDRDVTWVLSDWRLAADAADRGDFDSLFDATHGGRLGNTITLNGRFPLKDGVFEVRSGERIRLRLVNSAVARIFQFRFQGHDPRAIAFDGHPVAPHAVPAGVALGPGMRVDLIIDCMGRPGERFAVSDVFYPRPIGRLIEFVYRDEAPLRARPLSAPIALPDNPLSEPDVARAARHEIVFQGGAMGSLSEAVFGGEKQPIGQLMRNHGVAWAVNGVAMKEHAHDPMLVFRRGAHVVLAMHNDTAWHHPIHLHGHVFRLITRNGRPTQHREWLDSVLMAPRERVEIAFVADNPGDWMFHCHVLAHQHGGMMATIRVA